MPGRPDKAALVGDGDKGGKGFEPIQRIIPFFAIVRAMLRLLSQ
jgi:hypothetical protein